MQTTRAHVDLRALREQCSLPDDADPGSPDFVRFIVRLGEALDRDIPVDHWAELATLPGCSAYLKRLETNAAFGWGSPCAPPGKAASR